MSNAATWPGLIRHTALAGHVILVGSAHRVSRFVPSFRDAKLAVTTLTELNELEASLLCSFKTMVVVFELCEAERRRLNFLTEAYPEVLFVDGDEILVHPGEETGSESTNSNVDKTLLKHWFSWMEMEEQRLEQWMHGLESLMPNYTDDAGDDDDLLWLAEKIGCEYVWFFSAETRVAWTGTNQQKAPDIRLRAAVYDLNTPVVLHGITQARYIEGTAALPGTYAVLVPVEVASGERAFVVASSRAFGRDLPSTCILLKLFAEARLFAMRFGKTEALDVIVELLVHALSGKDGYTAQHSDRVAILAREIGRELGLNQQQLEDCYLGGRLHDIGKLWVENDFLTKAGPLTPHEYEALKLHTITGSALMARFPRLGHLHQIVLSHHERVDGGGYPNGLSGDEIPLIARIVSVADAFDAMTTDRSYRRGRPSHEALKELVRCVNRQFDSRVVNAFTSAYYHLQPSTHQQVCETSATAH